MTKKYHLLLASDVNLRNGMGLELIETASGLRVAEIFRDDDTGERSITVFREQPIPLVEFEWFLQEANVRL